MSAPTAERPPQGTVGTGSRPVDAAVRESRRNGVSAVRLPPLVSSPFLDAPAAPHLPSLERLRAALPTRSAWAAVASRVAAPGLVLFLAGVVHAWGMKQNPNFFDDEGTYVSQAWSVDKLHTLAPYTYWYDHPPAGWIALAAWSVLTGGFNRADYAVADQRVFMLVVAMVAAWLIYVVARRLGANRFFATLAIALFTLSPLSVHYQRMVLLDNIAVAWILAACALALTPSKRLVSYAGSGACFALAVLTKETFLLFLPALAFLVWQRSSGSTRRYSVAMFGAAVVTIGTFYPLFAALRGELLAGAHTASLQYGITFQLTREGGGSIFHVGSGTRSVVVDWLRFDTIVPLATVCLLPVALLVRRLRWLVLALLPPAALLFRPGTYVPAMFVVGMLPFAALLVALVADWLWQSSPQTLHWHRLAPLARRVGVLASVACVVLVGALAATAAPRWASGNARLMTVDDATTTRAAVNWLDTHASHDSRLLVDNTLWVDLVERGFSQAKTIWFYKLDLDPAIQIPVDDFDYVVVSNYMAGNLDRLPRVRAAVKRSRIVVSFAQGNERIDIRRIVKPAGTRLKTNAYRNSRMAKRG
jgi:Dolichyl-phosphate-mannose-protein mannosyltransferase